MACSFLYFRPYNSGGLVSNEWTDDGEEPLWGSLLLGQVSVLSNNNLELTQFASLDETWTCFSKNIYNVFLTESVLWDFGYFDVGLFLWKYFFLESMNFPKTFLEILFPLALLCTSAASALQNIWIAPMHGILALIQIGYKTFYK